MSQYYRITDRYTRNYHPIRQISRYTNTTDEYKQRNLLFRSNDAIEIKIPVDYLVSILAIFGLYFLGTKNFNLGTILPLLATNDGSTDDIIKKAMDILNVSSKEGKTGLGTTENTVNESSNQEKNMPKSDQTMTSQGFPKDWKCSWTI